MDKNFLVVTPWSAAKHSVCRCCGLGIGIIFPSQERIGEEKTNCYILESSFFLSDQLRVLTFENQGREGTIGPWKCGLIFLVPICDPEAGRGRGWETVAVSGEVRLAARVSRLRMRLFCGVTKYEGRGAGDRSTMTTD